MRQSAERPSRRLAPVILSPMAERSVYESERRAVLEAARAMHRAGLVAASSGNASMRVGPPDAATLAITTAGKDYAAMGLDEVVVVDFDGEPIEGDGMPSTEMLLHTAIYRARPDVRAVMHTHSIYASALAVAGRPLPPLADEMVVAVGGAVEASEYAFPGTEELGEAVVAALGERNAALVRNHGLVGVGVTLDEALRVCEMTERAAHIYAAAKAFGEPSPLPPDAVETEQELFRMRREAGGR